MTQASGELHEPDRPWRAGLAAARVNLLPGMVLWVVAVAVVGGYYGVAPVRGALQTLAMFKLEAGLGFAVVSTAAFGGLLPLLIQHLLVAREARAPWRDLPFLLAYWAYKGAEVDLLYITQARVFGDSADWSVILPKLLLDQFIYVPLWVVPTTVLPFLWKDCGYSIARTRAALGSRWYRRRGVPLLLANWGVWLPTAALIYCLPLPLQLPLQNLVLCLWSLLVIVMTARASAGVGARR